MIVTIDVYTKDVNIGTEAFKLALDCGATNVNLCSNECWETKKFECLNLRFDVDHKSPVIEFLDKNNFSRDADDL